MAKYRFVGDHAETLADGRPVGPGDFVDLSDDEIAEDHNAMLVADERLIGTGSKSSDMVEKIDKRETRRQQREGDSE